MKERVRMQITVKLFASFRKDRFITASREVEGNACIADIINMLQIPAGEVGTIMLNNRHAEPGQKLQEGDRLGLFPLVGGG